MPAPVQFLVQARAEPQTLGRLINHIAQLGLTPVLVSAEIVEGALKVIIEQDRLDDRQAGIIAEKMRSSVAVKSVGLKRGERLLIPLSEQRL